MIRKTTVLAMAFVVVAALAPPVAAAAVWKHASNGAIQENVNLTLAGPFSFNGSLGGVSCGQTTGTLQLTAGQDDADVSNLAVDNPNGCATSGALAFCQLQSVTFEGTNWAAHTNAEDIQVTNAEFQNHLSGSFCPTPTMQLNGTITMTLGAGQAQALHQGQYSGTVQATTGKTSGTNLGTVTVSGSWTATPAKTYGVGEPFYYVEGEEAPIGEEGEALEAEVLAAAPTGWKLILSNEVELGPCAFTAKSKVWNVPGGGRVEDSEMKFTLPCETSLKECQVTAGQVANEPWTGTLHYKNNVPTEYIGTVAKPIKFTYTLVGVGCGVLNGSEVVATAEGAVPATHFEKGCYQFKNAGKFATSIPKVTGALEATYCRSIKGGKSVPAK